MRTLLPVLLLILAMAAAGSLGTPGITLPKARLVQGWGPDPGDCFVRVNDSAHSAGAEMPGQIIITGYAANICSRPMSNLVIHGVLLDPEGREVAGAETPRIAMGSGDLYIYALTFGTPYSGPYTYRLEPVIREEHRFF